MPFKFEKLEVWQLGLDYVDLVYELGEQLPRSEENNLKSQMIRAATSVTLNIAEGSTGQTDVEQARFLGLAIRSLLETVACLHLIKRRNYVDNSEILKKTYRDAEILVAKLHAMRRAISPERKWLREGELDYQVKVDKDE
jgi:four helix bundle protein